LQNNKKLIVNAKSLLSPLTGIGRYTYEIVTRLPKNEEISYYYDYFGKVSSEIYNTFEQTESHVSSDIFKLLRKLVTSNQITKKAARAILASSKIFKNNNFDVYWEPSIIPEKRLLAAKNVITVHDMSLHLHSSWHKADNVDYFKKNFWKYIDRADIIITDTNAVRSEVAELTKVNPDRIAPIHLGVNHDVFKPYPEEEKTEFRKKYNIERKQIVFVGSIEPRKNLERLIKAYKILPDHIKNEYSLTLAGYQGWKNTEIHSLIESEKDNIKYLGSISDKELALLYNTSALMVYPSLYEGFGLPPLEAMACGLPVITSSIACLNEVCGEASFRVDPYDIESIRNGILTMAENEQLQKESSIRGLAHASGFLWSKTAELHNKVFSELV
jgi:glycosyltransferase involved in cell wall biosynthesis